MENFLIEKIEEIAFSTVSKDEALWESGILDSITIVELAVEIENEYNIEIASEEIIEDHFQTVALIEAFVQKKLAEQNA